MLGPTEPNLDEHALTVDAESARGVFLTLACPVYDVLGAATAWSGVSLAAVLDEFPRHIVERLEEIEASVDSQQDWSGLSSDE